MFILGKNNKKEQIIIISILLLVFLISCYILANSEFNNEIKFRWIINQNTGAPISFIGSVVIYILLWGLVGLIPSVAVFLFALLLFCFLYRKAHCSYRKSCFPEYDEFDTCGKIAFVSTYIAAGILLLLHILNIVTIVIP